MDAMEIATAITAAIVSNPNYKPGTGKEEVKLFKAVLKEITAALEVGGAVEVTADEEVPTVRNMRVRRSPLGTTED